MSETAPTGQSALEAERARIATQRAEADLAEGILNQEEAFGKYDENVTPAEGEFTYSDYLSARPRELTNEGGVIRDAESGKFGSSEAFSRQNESQQDYYDRVGGLVNEGEWEAPDYENMGVAQLAKEVSKARALGDKAAADEAVEAAINHLTIDAMKDDSESSADAQARFESEVSRFEQLIDRFSQAGVESAAESSAVENPGAIEPAKAPRAAEVSVSESSVPEASAKSLAGVESAGPAEAVKSEEVESKDDAEAESEPESESEPKPLFTEVEYNGEKYALGDVFISPSGEKVAKIYNSDGTPMFVSEDDIKPVEARQPSKDLVVLEKRELVTVDQEKSEREASALEKLKGWFKKERKAFQTYGGSAYWGHKWDRAKAGFKDKVLDFGVTEEMEDDEKDRLRKRNRVAVIAGGSLLAVGAIYMFSQAISGDEASSVNELSGSSGAGGGGAESGSGVQEAMSDELKGVLNHENATGAGTEIGSGDLYLEPVTIERGMGGEELFQNMGLDKADWYTYQNDLLKKFPDDFYRMTDGHVGLMYAGDLPTDVQQYIESLK